MTDLKKNWYWSVFGGIALVSGITLFGGEISQIDKISLSEKYNSSQEIKSKYQLDGVSLVKTDIKNAELDRYKNEPKDEVKITLGDKDKTEFVPNIELKRWNEVSFKIKPKGLEIVATQDKSLSFENNKIKFGTPKMNFEMYEYTEGEGGYKYIWYLNEKPVSNIVEFDIETSGLDFFYQPELTTEEITQGMIRPEDVIGSYAVYHSTKGKMNDINGKDYKVGKAFHIFRPHLIDANGLEAWGNLHIENGIYSVEIPQDFLDKAVYPIKSNDTFGYEGVGGSTLWSANVIRAYRFTGAVGTGNSMSANIASIDTKKTKMAIYLDSDNSRIDTTSEYTTSGYPGTIWITQNLASSPTLSAVSYLLAVWSSGASSPGQTNGISFDTGSIDNSRYDDETYGTWPTTFADTEETNDYRYFIYTTYTPSGGGGAGFEDYNVIPFGI